MGTHAVSHLCATWVTLIAVLIGLNLQYRCSISHSARPIRTFSVGKQDLQFFFKNMIPASHVPIICWVPSVASVELTSQKNIYIPDAVSPSQSLSTSETSTREHLLHHCTVFLNFVTCLYIEASLTWHSCGVNVHSVGSGFACFITSLPCMNPTAESAYHK